MKLNLIILLIGFYFLHVYSTSLSIVTSLRVTKVTTTDIESPHHNSGEEKVQLYLSSQLSVLGLKPIGLIRAPRPKTSST
jgi:hypothetical protein